MAKAMVNYSGAVFVEYVLRDDAQDITQEQLEHIAEKFWATDYEGLVAIYSEDLRKVKVVLPHTNAADSAAYAGIAVGECASAVEGEKLIDFFIKHAGCESFDAGLAYVDTTLC